MLVNNKSKIYRDREIHQQNNEIKIFPLQYVTYLDIGDWYYLLFKFRIKNKCKLTQKTKPDNEDVSLLYFCNAWNQLQFLNHILLSLALTKDKLKAVSLNQQILAINMASKSAVRGNSKRYGKSQRNLCIYHFQF